MPIAVPCSLESMWNNTCIICHICIYMYMIFPKILKLYLYLYCFLAIFSEHVGFFKSSNDFPRNIRKLCFVFLWLVIWGFCHWDIIAITPFFIFILFYSLFLFILTVFHITLPYVLIYFCEMLIFHFIFIFIFKDLNLKSYNLNIYF